MALAFQTLNVVTTEAQLMEIARVVLGFVVPTWSQPVPLQSPITVLMCKTLVIPLPTQPLVTVPIT